MKANRTKEAVKSRYAAVALYGRSGCCAGNYPGRIFGVVEAPGRKTGYSESDLQSVPQGANLGLGCGNPVAHALLKEGEVVLDLGSGAGFDAFLAAARVGKSGKVVGVDMTPEMIRKARVNAVAGGFENVEFRLGEIEELPVSDNEIDVVISNCVINLSTDKEKVFREALRVLRPGGRLIVSDLVLVKELPEAIRNSVEAYAGCIAGALIKDTYLAIVKAAGFGDLKTVGEKIYPVPYVDAGLICSNSGNASPGVRRVITSVAGITVWASKPL